MTGGPVRLVGGAGAPMEVEVTAEEAALGGWGGGGRGAASPDAPRLESLNFDARSEPVLEGPRRPLSPPGAGAGRGTP